MHHMDEGIKLQPYRRLNGVACPMCGADLNVWDRFSGLLRSQTPSVVTVRYCPGGKEPSEKVAGLRAHLMGETEAFNPCAGVSEPHLHLTCRGCGYEYLMHTKS